jgi:hypothetical protein
VDFLEDESLLHEGDGAFGTKIELLLFSLATHHSVLGWLAIFVFAGQSFTLPACLLWSDRLTHKIHPFLLPLSEKAGRKTAFAAMLSSNLVAATVLSSLGSVVRSCVSILDEAFEADVKPRRASQQWLQAPDLRLLILTAARVAFSADARIGRESLLSVALGAPEGRELEVGRHVFLGGKAVAFLMVVAE